jgi:hypothetical protein
MSSTKSLPPVQLSSEMKVFLNNVPPPPPPAKDQALSASAAVAVMIPDNHSSTTTSTTFDLFDNENNDDDDDVSYDDDYEEDGPEDYDERNAIAAPIVAVLGSLCEFFVSMLFIPFWLKTIVGGVFFLRTLVLGYFVHVVWQFQTATEQATMRWIGCGATLGNGSGGTAPLESGCHTKGPWPPPTLLGLGVLTIVALIVHPDGYTWIFLRKIRFVFYELFDFATIVVSWPDRVGFVLALVQCDACSLL